MTHGAVDAVAKRVLQFEPSATYGGGMKAVVTIEMPELAVREFCQRHQISKLSLFGSVLREDFGPASDVDVLVEFEPSRSPGLREPQRIPARIFSEV